MTFIHFAMAVAMTVGGFAPAGDGAALSRGELVSSALVVSLDAEQVKDLLEPLKVYVPQAKHGVDVHRVVYRTVGVGGKPTTASGLVILPRTAQRSLRPAIWLHGTQSYRHDAPSRSDCCDNAAGVLFGSLGYAVAVPDYLGLGSGPGTHPYFHAPTMVSASLDALRATRGLADRYGREVGGGTVVSGFSQGANVSMLLARSLQYGADGDFRLSAVAPISGGYELFETEWPAALDGRVEPRAATYYLAYVTVAWNRIYHLYRDEAEVFRAPYAGKVAALFDGEHTIEQTMAALPRQPSELFEPGYIAQLRQPRGRLRLAALINDNACLYWTPAVPVRMYASRTDPEAVYANSTGCKDSLRGADVTLTDVGETDHITSLVLSIPQVATWFASIR